LNELNLINNNHIGEYEIYDPIIITTLANRPELRFEGARVDEKFRLANDRITPKAITHRTGRFAPKAAVRPASHVPPK
jgi:hypothetical protein